MRLLRRIMLGCSVAIGLGLLGGMIASNYWYCYYWKSPCLIGFNAGSVTVQRSPSCRNNWLASGWSHSRRRIAEFSYGMTRFGVESRNDFDISVAGWQLLSASTFLSLILLWRVRLDGRAPAGHCQQCRYDLTGNISGICPECGTRVIPFPAAIQTI